MNVEAYAEMTKRIGELYEEYRKKEKNKQTLEFWHYTSLKGVREIFRSYIDNNPKEDSHIKKCTIYASNIHYMNDPQECSDGLKMFDSCKGKSKMLGSYKNKHEVSDKYSVISFSSKGDNLGHWKWYGKQSGISVCFNMDNALTSTIKGDANYDGNNKPLPVQYSDVEKKELFKALEKRVKSNALDIDELSSLFVPFCKDESYSEEFEHRMVFYDIEGKSEYAYNETKDGWIKPALVVKMKVREKQDADSLLSGLYDRDVNENIVKKFVVGPGADQELVFNALVHMLDTDNYIYCQLNEGNVAKKKAELLKPGEVAWIECVDGKVRYTYRCHNGIDIMKSAVAFRG